jgi:hypothetical protein
MAMKPPPSLVAGADGGVITDGDKGIFVDAVENRSGVVDRVRLLPIKAIMPPFALGN